MSDRALAERPVYLCGVLACSAGDAEWLRAHAPASLCLDDARPVRSCEGRVLAVHVHWHTLVPVVPSWFDRHRAELELSLSGLEASAHSPNL